MQNSKIAFLSTTLVDMDMMDMDMVDMDMVFRSILRGHRSSLNIWLSPNILGLVRTNFEYFCSFELFMINIVEDDVGR